MESLLKSIPDIVKENAALAWACLASFVVIKLSDSYIKWYSVKRDHDLKAYRLRLIREQQRKDKQL